jgi:hypothetical protein
VNDPDTRRIARGRVRALAAVMAMFATAALPGAAGANGGDETPPDTVITSATVSPGSATFEFTGTDNVTPTSQLAFKCRLDGGALTLCTSPKAYTGISAGAHVFTVAAVDQDGNFDPYPARFEWSAAEDHSDATVPDGGTVTTGAVATPTDPTVSSVENQSGATRTISIDEFDEPTGDLFCNGFTDCVGQVVDVTAGATTAAPAPAAQYPFQMTFRFDASVLVGKQLKRFSLIHDGVVVPKCSKPLRRRGAECIVSRVRLADGDFQLVVDSPDNGRIRGR